jgi:hypothetical protein
MNRFALIAVAVLLLPMPTRATEPAPATIDSGKVVAPASTSGMAPVTADSGKVVGVTDSTGKKPAGEPPSRENSFSWWGLFSTLFISTGLLGYLVRFLQEKHRKIFVFAEDPATNFCKPDVAQRLLPCPPFQATHFEISFTLKVFSEKANPLALHRIKVEFAEKQSRKPRILAAAPLGIQTKTIGRITVADVASQDRAEFGLPSRQFVKMKVQGWVQGEEVKLAEKCKATYLSAETAGGKRMRWQIFPPKSRAK